MKGDLGNIMKQAQKMQEQMMKAQEELATLVVTGESGGGMVAVEMSGQHEIKKVSIDDTLIGDDKDMLEDLLAAAMNDAVRKVGEASQGKMGGLGGMLPEGFKLPF